MALSLRIPGLLSLMVVKKPAEILAVNAAAAVDRPLSGRGGLVNRSIAAKLQVFRTAEGEIWPAFCTRHDAGRMQRSKEVAEKLTDIPAKLQSISGEIAELAAYVRGKQTARSAGVIVQQAVGKLFFTEYRASEESFDAAKTLSIWLRAGPLRTRLLRRSGKVQAAVIEVLKQARQDTACAHGTGLALHNIVESIELMRKLARSESRLKRLSPADAVALALRAPERVVREARDGLRKENLRTRERSIVLMAVESARQRSSDPGIAFFSGQWNQCPAHAFVPALLAEVWKTASAEVAK